MVWGRCCQPLANLIPSPCQLMPHTIEWELCSNNKKKQKKQQILYPTWNCLPSHVVYIYHSLVELDKPIQQTILTSEAADLAHGQQALLSSPSHDHLRLPRPLPDGHKLWLLDEVSLVKQATAAWPHWAATLPFPIPSSVFTTSTIFTSSSRCQLSITISGNFLRRSIFPFILSISNHLG